MVIPSGDDVVEEEVRETVFAESVVQVVQTDEKPLAPPKYKLRPLIGEKFQAQNVRDIILTTMQQQLMGRQYRADQASRWVETIVDTVRQRVQDLKMKRYKIAVQSIIIEAKGAAGVGLRCIWDLETDDYAVNSYQNDTILCYTICYGVYLY